MAIAARAVLHAARDAHPSLDKQSTPDAVALRWLAQHQQALLQEIAQVKRDAVHGDQTIAVAGFDFDAGAAIDAHLHVHGGKVVFTDAQRPAVDLKLVEYPLRLTVPGPGVFAGYIRARTLFLVGVPDDWTDVASVVLDLFPAGPDDLAPADALVLPGQALRGCTAALAAFMAGRVTHMTVSVPDPGPLTTSYLDEVTDRRRAKVGRIREVY